MKPVTLKGALQAAAVALLLPCAVYAAPLAGGKDNKNPGRPQVGQPVTAHSVNVDLRNLPKATQWRPGMPIREAHRRQYTPIGTKLPHAPADKPTARDRLNELQEMWDTSPRAAAPNPRCAAGSASTIRTPASAPATRWSKSAPTT